MAAPREGCAAPSRRSVVRSSPSSRGVNAALRARAVACLVLGVLTVALRPRSLCAQACVPADPCTTDGMCTNGRCVGTPQDGGPCDDVNDCTINDRCLPGHSGCRGDPAPAGSVCAGGCGTCLPVL